MVTVRLLSERSGKPIVGTKVSLGFDGLTRGVTKSEYTDQKGEAHFNADPGDGKVFVDGSTKYKGRLTGRVIVYV